MIKFKRLGSFLEALFSTWGTRIWTSLGAISTLSSFFPLHVSWRWPIGIAVPMFLIAGFLVYCKQAELLEGMSAETGVLRHKLVAAEDSVKDLLKAQELVESLESQLRQERRDNASLSGDVSTLRDEVKRLGVKPYTEAQMHYAQSLLNSMTFYERDTLRFLLLHGDVRGDALYTASTSPIGHFDYAWAKVATERGLIQRTDSHLTGYSTFILNKEMREVCKRRLKTVLKSGLV
jgi:hypothetical protein